ncbi:MAG: phenylacetate--CoA ligase family protein [Bacteroidetes bacterium]|nr:phenylacetate--CoA ligase family protein [Bacteroidota bacterium]
MQSQFFDKKKLQSIQTDKLKHILYQAVHHVPYYHHLKSKIDFNKFSQNELNKFPVVDKELIRNNLDMFISDKINKKYSQWSHTSGSSGKPFHFILPFYSDSFENIMSARAWSMGLNYQYKPNDPIISLRSYAPKQGEPLLRRRKNIWYLSAFDINENNLEFYQKTIQESGAKIIRGYASSIYIFSLLLKEKQVHLDTIKTVVTSSESFLPKYREAIEEHWGFKVLDWYGQNERSVTVQQCSFGNYHNNDEYGIVELDENSQILATSLNNDVMPLIRYATSDIAIKLEHNIGACECKRGLSIPFKGIDGRSDDILLKDDSTKIPTANIYTAMQVFEKIKQFKITQNTDKSLRIELVEHSPIIQSELDEIRVALSYRVGDLPMTFQIVPEIIRSQKTGKIKAIESFIK